MNFSATIFLFSCTVISFGITQNWSTVPKWADVGLYGRLGFKELDFKLGFLMDNYEIISLEKCLNDGHGMMDKTEEKFVSLTSRMRELRPDSNSKILNYWSVGPAGFYCYKAHNNLVAEEDLWLKDDNGYTVYFEDHDLPHYDFRSEEGRNLWIKAAIDPVIQTSGGANGVFLDGTEFHTLQNCRYKTCGENRDSCCVFSSESEAAYNQGIILAISSLRAQIHDLDPNNIVIGNGLFNYDFNAGKGNPTYEAFVDIMDGFCMEHVMGFESVNRNAEQQPFINIPALENLIQLRNLLVEKEKFLLVRSFPGPVGSPIITMDGLSTPQFPEHYPYPNPQNNIEMQQTMKDLFTFPLAIYLCAFADSKVFYTYSVWYDVRQSVPCIENPQESQFPQDFDEFLLMNPGPPLEEPTWEGRVCSRRFTNFGISVDLENENSATWFP